MLLILIILSKLLILSIVVMLLILLILLIVFILIVPGTKYIANTIKHVTVRDSWVHRLDVAIYAAFSFSCPPPHPHHCKARQGVHSDSPSLPPMTIKIRLTSACLFNACSNPCLVHKNAIIPTQSGEGDLGRGGR